MVSVPIRTSVETGPNPCQARPKALTALIALRHRQPVTALTVVMVRVTQRRRHGHQTYWRVVLPDGSRAELPATWTDQPTTEFASFARESAESLATPQALRDLLTVVEPLLVDSYQLREPCPEDLSGGGSDGQAAGIVRT